VGVYVRPIKFAAAILGCGLLLAPGASFSAGAAVLNFRCTNTTSHVSWTLKVDDIQHTADGFPATITPSTISWRQQSAYYDLDRKTGELTFSAASSTGGFTLFHTCQLTK
jgi:hypothetical protein